MFEHIREMFNKIVAYHGEESPECVSYFSNFIRQQYNLRSIYL